MPFENQGYPGEAALAKVAGNRLPDRPYTKRDQLMEMQHHYIGKLNEVNDALAALDAHPELEQFINTLQKAGV